jgi:DNA-nicking Smr family endonuclease
MNRRRLSDEERALWKGITRSVKPLRTLLPDQQEESPQTSAAGAKRNIAPSSPPALRGGDREKGIDAKPPAPPLAPLGRRLKKRVARGTHAIDVRIDLHGMTQSEAHYALLGFLRTAQARGASIALVITGKGGVDAHGERGVLRRQVPLWLRLPEFRGFVVGFESAGRGHGGEGALYVRLRKARQP